MMLRQSRGAAKKRASRQAVLTGGRSREIQTEYV